MKLYDTGVYLLNGKEIVPETEAKLSVPEKRRQRIRLLIQS